MVLDLSQTKEEKDVCLCGHSKARHQYWKTKGYTKCVNDYLECISPKQCKCKRFKGGFGMKSNERKLIEENCRENLFKKVKLGLKKLQDNKKYKDYDDFEQGFQEGWNDALENFLDNELNKIKWKKNSKTGFG